MKKTRDDNGRAEESGPGGSGGRGDGHLRMLVNEFSTIIDLIVDDEEQVILGVVLGDVLVGIFLLLGHFCGF